MTSKADDEDEAFDGQAQELSLSVVCVFSEPKFNEDDEAETTSLVLERVESELLVGVPVVIA